MRSFREFLGQSTLQEAWKGGLVGGTIGGTAGAALGSLLGPWGTIGGGMAGAALGSAVGNEVGPYVSVGWNKSLGAIYLHHGQPAIEALDEMISAAKELNDSKGLTELKRIKRAIVDFIHKSQTRSTPKL